MTEDNIDQVPFLWPETIEDKAHDFLSKAVPRCLRSPQRTPLLEIIEYMKNYGVTFYAQSDLGANLAGEKIGAKCVFAELSIYIDQAMLESGHYHWLLAHEIAHIVLHRKVKLDQSEYDQGALVETEINWRTGKRKIKTARDRMEWQADRFAAAILMPRETFLSCLILVQTKLDIRRSGHVYVSNQPYSVNDFSRTIHKMSDIYDASVASIEYRLKDLELITDDRSQQDKHISNINFSRLIPRQ